MNWCGVSEMQWFMVSGLMFVAGMVVGGGLLSLWELREIRQKLLKQQEETLKLIRTSQSLLGLNHNHHTTKGESHG